MRIRFFFFFSSRRRHTRSLRDWSSDVCSSDLTAARQAGLSELVIGIRPEHLHLADGNGNLAGEVTLVEELGADALLHVHLAESGSLIVARAEGRKTPPPGQQVKFRVQPDDVF